MESSIPALSAPLAETEAPLSRRNSCLHVFQRMSKSAWRRFGGSSKESRPHTPSACERPIETLVVDEEIENTPPLEDQRHRSEPLQVDPNESCDFTFEASPAAYMVHTSSNDRMSALCARYGLPHDADALRPTPSDRPREPRSTRLRIRVACHVCNSIFKGEKSCSKCGHPKCTDCKRKSVTEPRLSTETNHLIVVDDGDDSSSSSDDDKSIGRSIGPESRPRSGGEPEIDCGKVQLPRPVIERSKHVCHECSGEFNTIANSVCGTCGHEKCPRCSRQLWHIVHPYNDAGESGPQRPRQQRVHRPLRQRVRHFCDRCGLMFAPGMKVCAECLHARCESCPRHPSKRRRLATGRDPDPEVLRTEEARMTEVSVPTASTSGTWNQVIQ